MYADYSTVKENMQLYNSNDVSILTDVIDTPPPLLVQAVEDK